MGSFTSMGYKVLGYAVWQGAKWYLRRRAPDGSSEAGAGRDRRCGARRRHRRRPAAICQRLAELRRAGFRPLAAVPSRPMSDLPSALGIEAVELVAEGGRTVTVRVTGRWRRRRPELRGQAMLVVETGTVRQRFVAMPEPPSLTGAAPGTWRMSFTVPAELAPQLPGRTFLQLGAVMVPLPSARCRRPSRMWRCRRRRPSRPDQAPTSGEPRARPGLLEARQLRSSELAAESARRRAAEADGGRGRAALPSRADRGGAGRGARRVRPAAGRDLRARAPSCGAPSSTRMPSARSAARSSRRWPRRRGRPVTTSGFCTTTWPTSSGTSRGCGGRSTRPSTLPPPPRPRAPTPSAGWPSDRYPLPERGAAAPTAMAPRAARAAARAVATEPEPRRRARQAAGAAGRRRSSTPGRRRPARAAARAGRRTAAGLVALDLEPAMVDAPLRALDGEGARWRSSASSSSPARSCRRSRTRLPARAAELAGARRELERQRLLCERAYDAIARVRGELAQIGAGCLRPAARAARAGRAGPGREAERRARSPPRGDAGGAGPRSPRRRRPRPQSEAPAPPRDRPSRGCARRSGRLPPGTRPPPGGSCSRCSPLSAPQTRIRSPTTSFSATWRRRASPCPSATAQVDLGDTPRPLSEVDFQLVGDLASIARLLAAGPVRRRLGRLALRHPMARIRGDRSRFPALEHLIDAPLTLGQLHAAGVRLDPVLALTLAALMIEPEWTAGERFTIAHREPSAAVARRILAGPRTVSRRCHPPSLPTARSRASLVCARRRGPRCARPGRRRRRSRARSARSRWSGSGSIAHNPAKNRGWAASV